MWAVIRWAQRLMPPLRLYCQGQLVQGGIATANVVYLFSPLYGELKSCWTCKTHCSRGYTLSYRKNFPGCSGQPSHSRG